ncbi:hypothetical protein CWS02_24910 [Enterobacter sp. EA-1]|nr:hypothetical protein CWS02_24910 [Enterobacter sp. EA-1]
MYRRTGVTGGESSFGFHQRNRCATARAAARKKGASGDAPVAANISIVGETFTPCLLHCR